MLLAILTIGLIAVDAQTIVKEDKVLTVNVGQPVLTGTTVNSDFYGKSFFENTRVQLEADAVTTGGGVVLTVTTSGSMNYVDWFPLDTITISGTSNNTAVSQKMDVYYDYLRFATVVGGTGDSVNISLNLLLDVNE